MPSILVFALRAIWLTLLTAFWITAVGLAVLFTWNPEVALAMARNNWAPAILRGTNVRLRIEPLPQVDWSKPHVFAMNHQSQLDIPCVFTAIPANIRFVAKHTLKYVPFLGQYIVLSGMIFINRSNRKKALKSLARAGARIRQGANIIMYPEGTRSRTGRILPFKKGPFALALESGVPIIPIAIEGTRHALPKGTARFAGGEARLKVGEPIATNVPGLDREALLKRTRAAIIQLHQEIGGVGGEALDVAPAGREGTAEKDS